AVTITVLASFDPALVGAIVVWLAFYCVLARYSMPLVARRSTELSEEWSVVSGRIVDSYTNILTLKTFSTGEHEDRYVSQAIVSHAEAFYLLMRVFTGMWSVLFAMNACLLIAISWLSLSRWSAGEMSA